jgi:parallel beta-helix repeat protein
MARIVVPVSFVCAMIVAGALTTPWFRLDRPAFTHNYPGAPGTPPGDVFGTPVASVPPANIIDRFAIPTTAILAQALPPTAIEATADGGFRLLQPVLLADGARVTLTGPGTLHLAGGSYIEVTGGATLAITQMTLVADGPITDRGFLADVGGTMQLRHDRFEGLGRVATLASGISFLAPAIGSVLADSTVTDGSTGVAATSSTGLRIVGNRFSSSRVDGIDLRRDAGTVVEHNTIAASGWDGVELSGGVGGSTVRDNLIEASGRYGVMVYNCDRSNLLDMNTITDAFDGVVLNVAHHVVVTGNTVSSARRYAFRLSGSSTENVLHANVAASSPVGIYMSGGATRNVVSQTTFTSNGENVRIRTSAPGNVVVPRPAHSELRSA